jgi:hypothetical protein
MNMEQCWNDHESEKPKSSEKENCPSTTSSITNLKWTGPVSNPGFRDERQTTNYLNHDQPGLTFVLNQIKQLQFVPQRKYKVGQLQRPIS